MILPRDVRARVRKGKFRPRGVLWRMFLPVRPAVRGARHAAKLARFGGQVGRTGSTCGWGATTGATCSTGLHEQDREPAALPDAGSVRKYSGNKDTLFARVMSFESDAEPLLAAPLDDLGAHMVRHVLVGQSEQGADPLLRIVFAPLHGEQGDILRADFRTRVTDRLTDRPTGPDAGLRAEPAVATLLGLGVMYGIARGTELRASTVDALVDRYAPTVQAYLTRQAPPGG
ncbi:hypothetical protein ACFWAZ_07250 [Streptomyces collinus]|uniref:TetR/AcrR family transcriptional regulator n=1 Tax=Streptomyces collinus TaxID=42684 RepID=UPI003650BA93